MERIQTPIQVAHRRGGRRPLLTGPAVQELLQRQVAAGASLSQIRDTLAIDPPDGLGIRVSRTAIAQRLKAMGLKTRGISILAAATLSVGAEDVARRQIDAGVIRAASRKGQRRVPSWLSRYKTDIGRMIGEGLIYCEIWDALKAEFPLEPRFAVDLSDSAKSARIANFKHREKKKAVGRAGRKALLLKQFGEHQVEASQGVNSQRATAAELHSTPSFNAQRKAAPAYTKPSLGSGRAALPTSEDGGISRFAQKQAERANSSRKANPDDVAAVLERFDGISPRVIPKAAQAHDEKNTS